MSEEFPDQSVPRPTARDAHFGQGRPGSHPYAVMYCGEYETLWDGTAVAVRAHARALAGAGLPVLLKSLSSTVIDDQGFARSVFDAGLPVSVQEEVGALELTRAGAFLPIIRHLVVRDAEHLKQVILPRGSIGKTIEEQVSLRAQIFASTIVYSVWERDRVDPAIVQILSRVAECWVPSSQNRAMLVGSGVPEEKVVVVPHPFDPNDPILKLRRRKPDTEWRKFYSIGRWEPRKGYVKLVEAFFEAFSPTDQVVLTIKYTGGNWPGYETPEGLIERVSMNRRFQRKGWTLGQISARVKLIEGRFPRAAIHQLHYRNNIYVSASHGEAWCLPAFEACLAGNQVVYVPSGGVEDFVGNGHVAVTPHGSVPVPESYHWESDATWMGYSVKELAEALQKASAPTTHNPEKGIRYGGIGYRAQDVGEIMKIRVLEVARRRDAVIASGKRLGTEAATYYESLT